MGDKQKLQYKDIICVKKRLLRSAPPARGKSRGCRKTGGVRLNLSRDFPVPGASRQLCW